MSEACIQISETNIDPAGDMWEWGLLQQQLACSMDGADEKLRLRHLFYLQLATSFRWVLKAIRWKGGLDTGHHYSVSRSVICEAAGTHQSSTLDPEIIVPELSFSHFTKLRDVKKQNPKQVKTKIYKNKVTEDR